MILNDILLPENVNIHFFPLRLNVLILPILPFSFAISASFSLLSARRIISEMTRWQSGSFSRIISITNLMSVNAALHNQRFERASAATTIDSFGSDRKRPRWELNLFLLPKRPKIGRLRSDSQVNFYQLRMLLFGCSARALKTLDMESSLKISLTGFRSISFVSITIMILSDLFLMRGFT